MSLKTYKKVRASLMDSEVSANTCNYDKKARTRMRVRFSYHP